MKYLQVCQALYDYEARTPDEININENDILYVINMDDGDWWKAKIKQMSNEHNGPIGLVPATYLEEVSPIGKVRAEYDYNAQQEEEISFGEGQELWLLERDDPDWYLVKLKNGDIGLAPSNYIQIIDATTRPLHQQQQMENAAPSESASVSSLPNMISGPTQQCIIQTQHSHKDIHDEAQSWTVHEYDVAKKKKKKGKGNLLVGNALLCYGSETDKTNPVQQHPILDVFKYLFNGKNLHVEINGTNPAVLDLQASSKSEAKAIVVKITESRKTAQQADIHVSQRISGAPITNIPGSTSNINGTTTGESRWATSLYEFEAEGGEELSVGENERILVTDYYRDDGWWRVNTMDGKCGIIPSSYIQFHDDGTNYDQTLKVDTGDGGVDSAASDEVEAYLRRQQNLQNSLRRQDHQSSDGHGNQHNDEQKRNEDQQTRDEQEQERRRRVQEAARFAEVTRQRLAEEERIRGESNQRSSSLSPSTSNRLSRSTTTRENLPKPDPDRLRTWTDRSGSFEVEAQFLAFMDGKLRLHKSNGVKIDVPLEKMSAEDIRWVERRTDQPVGSIIKKLNQEKTPEMPSRPNPLTTTPNEQPEKSGSTNGRKSTNSNWDWFDWFIKIGIPMQEALVYSYAFKADNLDDGDLNRLTHKQMKTLGMKEKHVQRMERYIDTGNLEPPSDSEACDNTMQGDVTRQKQIETDEEMAKRLQKAWNESGGDKASSSISSSASTSKPPSGSAQRGIHPDLLDLLGSGSTPSNNDQPIKNTSGGHSDLIGFNDDAWAPRPVNETSRSHNQQALPVPKIEQHVIESLTGIVSQQPLPASTPTPANVAFSTSTPPSNSTTSSQKSKIIDPTPLPWQSKSSLGETSQSENNQRPSLNQLSQQEELRKYHQWQQQQSLLDQQQQIIMQQQQQIQQQQVHQQQVQLQQQQHQNQNQNQLLQQVTGYQQPNNANGLVMYVNGSVSASQPQQPQMTGYIQPQQYQLTGYASQQQYPQSQLYQHQQQLLPHGTGRHWHSSTPENPFGSPTKSHTTGPQILSDGGIAGGAQLSTSGLSAFTQIPTQSTSAPGYLQQLQPQMTGIQQTELSGARDKYAAFRTPNADVFTSSGSIHYD